MRSTQSGFDAAQGDGGAVSGALAQALKPTKAADAASRFAIWGRIFIVLDS